jgi:hypothetical protein
MFHPKTFYAIARVTKIFLMLLLMGFELVPSLSGGDAPYINQAALQLTRSQQLTNAAYMLAYRPAAEHAQAMYDLQTILPAFEKEQNLLLTNTTSEIQDLLQQARTDYLPIIAALQTIIAHPQSVVDPIEINIIVLHEHSYLITMNALLLILPRHLEDRNIQLFIIQIIIEVLFSIVFIMVMTTFVWEMHTQKSDRPEQKPEQKPEQTPFFVKRLIVFLLLFVLIGLEIVPLGIGNDTAYLYQATIQGARCQTFAKSTFVLAYRPVLERTQALSDVQLVLPLFQQEQATLSKNTNASVHSQTQAARSEYQTMSRAAQALITNPEKAIDPILVNTIVSHASSCLSAEGKITLAIQNQMQQQTTDIFAAEVAIEGAFIIFFGTLLLFTYDPFVPKEQRRARGLVI